MTTSGRATLPRHDTTEILLRSLDKRLSDLERLISNGLVHVYPLTGAAQTSWMIQHNLNRYVQAVVYDPGGNLRVLSVVCPDLQTVVLFSDSPFNGTAVIV